MYEMEDGSEASIMEPKRRWIHGDEAARHCWHVGVSREHCITRQICIKYMNAEELIGGRSEVST